MFDAMMEGTQTNKTRNECTWKEELDPGGDRIAYQTDCENAFAFDNGTPTENCFNYCCFCGRKLIEQAAQKHTIDTDTWESLGVSFVEIEPDHSEGK